LRFVEPEECLSTIITLTTKEKDYMNKYTHQNSINQALISDCNEKEYIISMVNALGKSSRIIFSHIVKQYLYYDFDMRESQELIANSTGYTRQTVNGVISELRKVGLLDIVSFHGDKFNFDVLNYIPNPLIFKFKLDLYTKIKSLVRVTFRHLQKLNLMGNPTPYKSFVSKPCKYMSQLLDTGKRGINFIKNISKPKRLIMNEAGELIISLTLRDITEKLKLTKLGQLKLLVFPDEVLSTVWKSCRIGTNIKSPFDWMIVGCEQYCKANKIEFSWSVFFTLMERYSIKDNRVYVRTKVEPKAREHASYRGVSEPAWKTKFSHLSAPHKSFEKYYLMSQENNKIG